jgi:hypothetical protein
MFENMRTQISQRVAEITQPQTPSTALTHNQTQALDEIIKQLDGAAPRKTIAVWGAPNSGKSTLATELLEGPRQRRTALRRKVVGFVADATLLDTRLTPWIQLVNSVLDKLTDLAQPTPPVTIADLKTELRELARLEARTDEASRVTGDLASAAFAHHWRTAFPRLILDVVTQTNSTFVVALDHLENLQPLHAAQLLEAAKYFLNAPGCTTVLFADEAALVAKLDATQAGADGAALLGQWANTHIALNPSAFSKPVPAQPVDAAAPYARSGPITKTAAVATPTDVPAHVLALLNTAPRPELALAQWRASMRAVIRRAQEGQPSHISAEMMAKVLVVRQRAKNLFESARLDATLLVGLERRQSSPRLAEVGNEFDRLVASDENLRQLLKSQPLFGSVEVKDLATALRLAVVEEDQSALAQALATPAPASVGASAVTAAQPQSLTTPLRDATAALRAVTETVTKSLTDSVPWVAEIASMGIATAVAVCAAAGIFIVDRVLKLIMLGTQSALGGLLALDVSALIPASANLAGSAAAIAAELVGIVLAALIFVYWGRNGRVYSAGLGLMIGAFAANLVDRLAYSAVLNVIHAGNLPTFNLAHVGLLAGVVLLVVGVVAQRKTTLTV